MISQFPSHCNMLTTCTVARDQYGNFLIQWILNNASPHLAEIVKAEIRYAFQLFHLSFHPASY